MRYLAMFLVILAVFGCSSGGPAEVPEEQATELAKSCTMFEASKAPWPYTATNPCCTGVDQCYVGSGVYYCHTNGGLPGQCMDVGQGPQTQPPYAYRQSIQLVQGTMRYAARVCANLTAGSLNTNLNSPGLCALTKTKAVGANYVGFTLTTGDGAESACVSPGSGERIWLHQAEPGPGVPPCAATPYVAQ